MVRKKAMTLYDFTVEQQKELQSALERSLEKK